MSLTPSPSTVNLQAYDLAEGKKKRLQPPLTLRYILKIMLLCLFWYSSSAANNIIMKRCLSVFPFPLTMTLVQFLGCSVLSFPVLKLIGLRGGFTLSKGLFITGILPLCVGKLSAVFFAAMSISQIPVSYSNTIKASLPIFSVFFSRLLLGQRHAPVVYFSLLLIISGVVISSFTELLFDLSGLISALLSTMSTALLSVYAKKSMLDNNLHYLKMLYFVSVTSFVCIVPVWFLLDVRNIYSYDYSLFDDPVQELLPYLLVIAFTNFSQNLAAFGFLSLVSPVSYSVGNCMKRVFTIGSSLVILKNPVTNINLLGMATAIGGVALYNKIKFDEAMRKKSLPVTAPQKLTSNGSNSEKYHTTLNIPDTKSDLETPPLAAFIA